MADSGSNNLLVVNIAGLGHASIGEEAPHLAELASAGCCSPVQPAVPALTGTSQATILTGTLPQAHGIVANGWYFRELSEILNWQRSARLVNGSPVWESFGKPPDSSRCANLFWRYATHATSQLNVTERPTYWVDGRKTPDIYTEPGDQRETLVKELGPFPLFGFWGPLAGIESTRWIVDATIRTIRQKLYGLVLSYLPHLDYDHQRFGPQSPQGIQALRDLDVEFGRLIAVARQHDMDVAVVSDYAFEAVTSPVYLNRVLRSEGLLAVQIAENGELLEPGYSRAFAVCDQQVAHIYVANDDDLKQVRQLVEAQEGVDVVYDRQQMQEFGLAHSRSGELFAIASPGHWFAYHYWLDESHAPDFAPCVAIHTKPGFDPTELFAAPGFTGKLHMAKRLMQKNIGLRIPFDVINTDSSIVRGSHGRIPTTNQTRPLFISSWKRETDGVLPMETLRDELLRAPRNVPS